MSDLLLRMDIKQTLDNYKTELTAELGNILNYWTTHTVDHEHGGFYGKIDNGNNVYPDAPKGSVMNARILWSYSAAYNLEPKAGYLPLAKRAYQYIKQYVIDPEFGGVYWTVDYQGRPLDTKKQVYAIAFVIYALSEYYQATAKEEVKDLAIELYQLLVEKSYDGELGGYFEAFTREWQPIADLRLSAKDANEKKTMNTHLHVLEAYTNLYRIWPDEGLKAQIIQLLDNFSDYMLDAESGHLTLFMDEHWNKKSITVSYGHDIEAAWLLQEAAEVIYHPDLITRTRQAANLTAQTILCLTDADGGLWYEYEPDTLHLIKEKHWWVQAEAMVGFFNAWQSTKKQDFLEASLKNWAFVKDKIIDHEHGEWFWGITADGTPMPNEDKAGLWKCPYHNSRACIEIIKRIA